MPPASGRMRLESVSCREKDVAVAPFNPAGSTAHPHSYTYTVDMKNITLSVDENILATVRRHAAERNSTVNALVREFLTSLAAHEDRAKRARARLRQLSAQSQGRLGKKSWTREDLHDG